MFGLLTPVVGVQEKLVPLLTIFGIKETPLQMVVSALLLMVGAFTVTLNVLTKEQVPKRAVSVYVVVVFGDKVGFAMFGLLTPFVGVQI
jgi:hypothetical protein